MQAENFLKALTLLKKNYPEFEIYFTDATVVTGAFETKFLEIRVDHDDKQIWVIFDTEDGCAVKMKDFVSEISDVVAMCPGYDIMLEDCESKNTFETYFSMFAVDDDQRNVEMQMDSDEHYERLDYVYQEVMEAQQRKVENAAETLCNLCDFLECNTCKVKALKESVVSNSSINNVSEIHNLLIEKVRAEYELYKNDVLMKTKEQIFEDCFDIVFHQRILQYVKTQIRMDFANSDLSTLLNTDRLLVKVYDIWTLRIDLSLCKHDDLKETFSLLLDDLKVQKSENNEVAEDESEGDEYKTDERYFVYDSKDNCVSGNGFHFEDEVISYANRNGYPTVKIHRYYCIDSPRGGKLYPDGEPEIVWKDGKPV